MFEKQLATKKIADSQLTNAQKKTLLGLRGDEHYHWVNQASEADLADYADDAALRDEFGYLNNEVDRDKYR